jgi:hypothetical protein
MKKGIIFILTAIFLAGLVSAQMSEGTVVSSSLADLGKLIIGIIVWIGKEILYGAAFVFGFQLSQTIGIIFAIVIWAALFTEMAKALRNFSSLSSPVAWIISFALTAILVVLGVIKAFGLAFYGLVSMFSNSTVQILGIGVAILLLIYIVIRLIAGKISGSIRKREEGIKHIKEEAGRKVFEKVGESMEGK